MLEPLLGRTWTDFLPRDDQPEFRRAVEDARKGKRSRLTALLPTFKGTKRWWDIQITPVLDTRSKKPERILAIARDITEERRQAEMLEHLDDGSKTRSPAAHRRWQTPRVSSPAKCAGAKRRKPHSFRRRRSRRSASSPAASRTTSTCLPRCSAPIGSISGAPPTNKFWNSCGTARVPRSVPPASCASSWDLLGAKN